MEENIEFLDKENKNSGNSNKRKSILIFVSAIFILAVSVLVFFFYLRGSEKKVSDNKNLTNSSVDSKVLQSQTETKQVLEDESKKVELKWDIKEEVLYTIPPSHKLGISGTVGYYQEPDVFFGSDGKEFAYQFFSEINKRWVSIVNGKEGGWIANISTFFKNISTSANLKEVKLTKKGGIDRFIYKGKDLGENERTIGEAFVSGDDKQNAYIVIGADTKYVFMNGKKSPSYRFIGMQTCSPDGQAETCTDFSFAYDGIQNAYIGQKSQMVNTIVINGVERESHREIHFPQFSFDSEHFAYKALDERAFIVIDGEEQKKYDGVYNVKFNNEGELTYNAVLGDKILFVTENLKPATVTEAPIIQNQQEVDQQKFDAMNFLALAGGNAHICVDNYGGVFSGNSGDKMCSASNVYVWPQIKGCGANPEDTKWVVINGQTKNWSIELYCKDYSYCNGKVNASCNSEGCVFSKNCDPR